MQIEEKYMMRCLELAKSNRSSVMPNPMVGAVIVHKGRIIGEGFHRKYGEAHAEVNAIQSVRDETLLRDSTLYVNLEPCAHAGKTPPCSAFILQKLIPRVVIGCLDPFPEVAGKGVALLRDTGVKVVTDVMKKEAMELNRFFMTAQTKQRPYVILKWAQSRDGYIDRIRRDVSERPVQLSTPPIRRHVHKLRTEVSAIMVGTNTVWLDNPFLTVRHWTGDSPVRVFLDRTLRIPVSYHLLDGSVRTIVFVQGSKFNVQSPLLKDAGRCQKSNVPYPKFPFEGGRGMSKFPYPRLKVHKNVEYIGIDFSQQLLHQVLNALYERGLYSLLVEGGACLHQSFLDSGLWDELQVETVPFNLGYGVQAPIFKLGEIAEFQRNIRFSMENFTEEEQPVISVYYCL